MKDIDNDDLMVMISEDKSRFGMENAEKYFKS